MAVTFATIFYTRPVLIEEFLQTTLGLLSEKAFVRALSSANFGGRVVA